MCKYNDKRIINNLLMTQFYYFNAKQVLILVD